MAIAGGLYPSIGSKKVERIQFRKSICSQTVRLLDRRAVPTDVRRTHALLSQTCRERRRRVRAHSAARCRYSKFDKCTPIGQATTTRRALRNLTGLPRGRAAHPGGPPFDKSVHITPSRGPRLSALAIASTRNILR